MKKNEFAKIVWWEGFQIVVMISYNPDDDRYELCQTTKIDGHEATVKAGFMHEKHAKQAFKEYSEEQSDKLIKSLLPLLRDETD